MLTLLVALIAAGVAYVWRAQARFNRPLERAVALEKERRYDAAIASFEQARLARPDDPAPLRGLARCYLGMGQFANATAWANKAVALDTTAESHILAAHIHLVAAGPWDPLAQPPSKLTNEARFHLLKAAEHGEAAIAADPMSAPARRVLAEAKARLGDVARASALIRQAAELAPNDRAIHLAAADILLLDGQPRDALEHCRRATKGLDPLGGLKGQDKADLLRATRRAAQIATRLGLADQAVAFWNDFIAAGGDKATGHVGLTIAYCAKRDYARAVDEGNRAMRYLATGPPNFDLHYHRGLAYFHLKRYARAAQELRSALTVRDDPNAHCLLGLALLRDHDPAAAREAFLAALKADPRHQRARDQLVELFEAEGNLALALDELRRGVEAAPQAREPLEALARFCIAHGREREAEKALAALHRLKPPSAKAAADLCEFYLRRGEPERALPLAFEAVRLQPNSPPRIHLLARAQAALERHSLAARYFQQALQLDPRYAPAYTDWADMLERAGQPQAADDVYRRARKALPGSSRIRTAYARFCIRSGRGDEGAEELKRLVERNRNDLEPRVALVDYFLAEGSKEKALAQAREAVDALPRNPKALALLARVRRLRGEWDKLRAVLSDMAKLPGDPAAVAAQRIAAHVHDGFYAAAVKVANQALEAQPALASRIALPKAVARFLADQQQPEAKQAVAAAARLASADTSDPNAGFVVSLMELALGEKSLRAPACREFAIPGIALEAWQDLALAGLPPPMGTRSENSGLKPLSPGQIQRIATMLLHAYVYEHAGWHDTAAQQMEDVLHVAPDCLYACCMAPVLWERAGNRARAIELCQRAIKARKGFAYGHRLLGDLLLLDGRADEAAAAYARCAATEDQPYDARTKLALIADAQGNYPSAIEAWRRILGYESRHVPATNNLAWLLATRVEPKLDEAAVLAQRAFDATPRHPAALDTIGWLSYLRGETRRALDMLSAATNLAPYHPHAWFHYGIVAAGDPRRASEAAKALRTGLQLAPDGPMADHARRLLRELRLDNPSLQGGTP